MSIALITTHQIIQVSGLSLSTIKRLAHDGTLHPIKIGRRKSGRTRDNRAVRYRVGEVAEFLGLTVSELKSYIDQTDAVNTGDGTK